MLRDHLAAPARFARARRRGMAAVGAAAGAAVFVFPLLPAPLGHLAARPPPVRATEVGPAADSHQPQGTGLYTVWCTGIRACVAGGNSEDDSGTVQPTVVAEAGGRWQSAARLLPPPNADPQPYAQLTGVTCRAARECVAVGTYSYGPSHDVAGFLATEHRGRWGRGVMPRLPVNAAVPARARLAAVACRPGGFCEAVGSYLDKAGRIEPMAIVKPAGGPWGRATEVAVPRGAAASPDAALTGLACTGPGACVAVGQYNVGPAAARGMGAVQTRGRWARAAGIPAPPGAVPGSFTGFTSVSCRPHGSCLAVGAYAASAATDRAMSVTESRGIFGRASTVTAVPAGAATPPSTALSGVSCPPAEPCVAVGVATSKAGHYLAMYAVRSAGRWAAAFLAGPANTATGRGQQSSLFSVSCAVSGLCTAVGYYNDASDGYSAAAVALGSR